STPDHASLSPPTGQPLQHRFPIFACKSNTDHDSNLEFTYFDHGTRTVQHFDRHLRANHPLLTQLPQFQMVYVALSPRNFPPAENAFSRFFPSPEVTSALLPLGRD